ncbi:MAG: sulfotransferase [Pseudomonadota bacterium]
MADLRAAAVKAISAGDLALAARHCDALEAADKSAPDAWVFRSRIAQKRSDYRGAAAASTKAAALAPDRLDVKIVDAECRMFAGDVAGALGLLDHVAAAPEAGEEDLKRTSALLTQLGRHQGAYDCAKTVMAISGNRSNSRYLVASTAIAVGKMEEAERLLDEVIAETPGEGDVYYNRAGLRRQTKERNHITATMKALLKLPRGDHGEAPLCYALGKELEDVGDHPKAFAAFSQGAAARRKQLSYDVSTDVQAAQGIRETFNASWAAQTPDGNDISGPIFILGLPRSGTTLVDRIVSAHSQVTSLEEVHDFAYAVIRAGFPAASKEVLMANAAKANMVSLGEEYWTALEGYAEPGPHFIDKTPANFLYLGLIAKALPKAKIIHVKRHPLAACYAMFKTLFRMGYPFSYDLQDVAQYYVAYHRLMAHWHAVFPGRILDVQYESLVDDQEAISREIIAHCGLGWEDAALDFHKNAAPSATASAAQVRQPIYRSARDLWRQHAAGLAPARAILEENGIPCA